MAKRIILPAKITIGFDYQDGQVAIVRFDVKYRASIDEHPEFPITALAFKPTLTGAQETQIKNLCKDVILPQIQ